MTVRAIGRSFSAHPVWLVGALLTFAALSAIVWYLASPLFVRTYVNEALPSPTLAPDTAEAAQTASTPVAPRVLRSGELGYVDGIHNGTGPVRIVDIGIPPASVRGVVLVARTAGLVAHLTEEAETPIGMSLWHEAEGRAAPAGGPSASPST